jgi:radical SAM protein with 4Fe4S-binding SPASM domain
MADGYSDSLWATPTSYGLVITRIDAQRNLHRVYLDNKAVSVIIDGGSEDLKKSLESRGINYIELRSRFNRIIKDTVECNRLIKKNNWLLFSLYPLQISVQTVNYCNAKCDFCYANVPSTSKRKAIEIDKIYDLKDYAALNGVKFGISGGEPLLHPLIYDILNYKNDKVFDTLITNLTSDFDTNHLIDTKVDLIQVSLHGYGKHHDTILGIKGAYDKIKNRIIELMSNVNMATNTVITPGNIHTIETMVKELNSIQENLGKKFSYVRFVPVLPSGTGYEKYSTNNTFMDDVKSLLIKLIGKYVNLEFEVPMLHSNPYEYFYDGNRWVCPAGSTVAVVRIDGRVIPCNQFLDTNVCSKMSIDQKSLHEIWLTDPLLSKMRRGIPGTPDKTSCTECRYLIMKEADQLSRKL